MPPEPIPPADPVAEPQPGLFSLAVLTRRWPLLLTGAAIGAALGVFIHLTSTAQYQSRAELLVVKRLGASGPGSDVRLGMVEDYVGAQLTIIKSEQVRRAAARELRSMALSTPLPEDDGAVAGMIQTGLSVSRDLQSPGTVGNGIVILTFRWSDPNDAKAFLDAVVKAYQSTLAGVYDSTTQGAIELARKGIAASQAKQEQLGQQKLALNLERTAITVEAPGVIQAGCRSRSTGSPRTASG